MARAHRQRSSAEEVPSCALRARVHTGIAPLTKRPHDLRETVPADPQARRHAEGARLLAQLSEHREFEDPSDGNPLLDRWLEALEIGTRRGCRRGIAKRVRPLLGRIQIVKLDAELPGSFYVAAHLSRSEAQP